MPIGGVNNAFAIGERQWQKIALSSRLEPDRVISLTRDVFENMPDAIGDALREFSDHIDADSPILRLHDNVANVLDIQRTVNNTTHAATSTMSEKPDKIHVGSYVRADGTVVAAHMRSRHSR